MDTLSLLAVWTWGSVVMLGWGLAAAIPVVIHLWSRRRFSETSWAAMEFLLAAMRKNARRLRIEQLLLLALRVAVLLLFALALADPRWFYAVRPVVAVSPSPVMHVFVLDASYSMSYRGRDQTRFEAAQQAVLSLVDHSRQGDAFSLMVMQDPPRLAFSGVTFDREEIKDECLRVQVSHGRADLQSNLLAVERWLQAARRRYPQVERAHLYWLTDLSRSTWGEVTRPDCQAILERLAASTEMSLIDVGDEGASNLAVTRLACERRVLVAGQPATIEAEVRAFGGDATRTRVEFLVNGRVSETQDIQVPAGGRATATIKHTFEVTGEFVVEARLATDALPLDNHRWLVLPVRSSLRVLCVQGEAEAGEYIALALNPTNSSESPVQVDLAPESALLDRPLERYDCVVLANVARVSFDEAEALSRFVRQGGGLITVLGDLVQADHYNRELGEEAGERRLLPGRLEQLVRGEHFFDPGDYQHPLAAPFRGHERAGLLTVPTWRFFQLRPYGQPEIGLTFDNQAPAVLIESIGHGRSVLVATALSPSSSESTAEGLVPWSALPTWPSFPPLVHELVRHATTRGTAGPEVLVLSPVEIKSDSLAATTALITLPDDTEQRIPCSIQQGASRATFGGTTLSGIYSAEFPAVDASKQPFAVNLDTRESDLSRVSLDMLPEALRIPAAADEVAVLPTAGSLALFRWLLGAVAVLLLAETWMAARLERRNR